MRGYSNLTVAGNVSRPLELRYTPSGNAVVDVNIAVNSKKGGQDTVTWCFFTAWGKTAETLNQYVNKGDPLILGVRDVGIEVYERRDGKTGTSLTGDIVMFTFVGGQQEQGDARPTATGAPSVRPAPQVVNEDEVPW